MLFEPSPQIALKVGCPTGETMASCLKMTDPALLTLAGSLSLTSSPDGKDRTSHSLVYIFIWDIVLVIIIKKCFYAWFSNQSKSETGGVIRLLRQKRSELTTFVPLD